MIISLKTLIAKHPKPSSGIFTFNNEKPLKLIIADRDGKPVSSYQELQDMPLSLEEVDFANSNWRKIKETNPSFYDGDVTAIIDVIYDEATGSLTFNMDKTKYSRTCAMYRPGYPVDNRFQEFISFGLGLMSNLEVGPDGSFLMIERSEKVYTEKGALSVPGGSLEYKEDKKEIIDDVKEGLKFAAVGELMDEILGEKNRQRSLKVELDSIMWDVNAQGRCGLNVYFGVTPTQNITRSEIYESFPDAKDSKESTGNFFFVNPYENIDQPGKNNLYATPRHVIELQKMRGSGKAALATQVYKTINDSYKAGTFSGLPPHPDSIANHFPNFNIFDVVKMCNVSIERPLSAPGTIVDQPAKKPQSFVEAMQAEKYGKMKNPSGVHEL